MHFLKFFLASNYSYLMCLLWHLGDKEYSSGLSFTAVDSSKMSGAYVGG